jgi:hypothetical protein
MVALEQQPSRRRRRWPFIVAPLATVVVVVTGAIGWWFTGGSETWARSHWHPPEQALLSSSMRVQPVAGWKVDVAELGLPPGSQITNGDSLVNTPGLIVPAGTTRTYLLASSPGPTPQWWLAGIDAGDGRVLFPPVKMGATNTAPSCFLNGRSVVCISENFDSATAWVVDGRSGTLTYTGPTDIRLTTGGKLKAAQAGSYLVAVAEHQGLYGVGPKAETTWFVPGIGVFGGSHNDDVAFQGKGREGSTTMFALKDGRVIAPEFPENADFSGAEFFDGGFAGRFYPDGRPERQFVQFFDTTAKLASDKRIEGQLIGTTANLTTIKEPDAFSVYDPHGVRLFKLPGNESHGVRLIGTTLWVSESSNIYPHYYQRYDLRTGEKGQPCAINLNYSLGTDGSVAVRAPINPKSDMLAEAFDLATCEMVWSIPRIPGSLGRVARIGDTLVRVSDDGNAIYSLVRP